MPESEDFKINIVTTATGDGAKKAEADLKKLNEEAKKSDPIWKSASERIAEAEANTKQLGPTATAAAGAAGAGGVAGLAAAGAAAAAGLGILASAVAGLNKLAPTLGASFSALGGTIKDSFLEVMGGSLKTAISDIFGSDFEQKLQRIAERFGAATAKMKLMGEASADYLAKQKSIVEMLQQENEARDLAHKKADNRAQELREEIELQEKLNKSRDEEAKENIDRDPRLAAGEKARAKEHVDIMAEVRAKQAADEQRASRLDVIDRNERAAETRAEQAAKREAAALGIIKGDYRKAGDLPPAQSQKLKDLQGQMEVEEDEGKRRGLRNKIAEETKVLIKEREESEKALKGVSEAADVAREKEDLSRRLEQEAYERRDRARARDAPINDEHRSIADARSGIKTAQGEEVRADSELSRQIKTLESDPKFQAGDTRGETKAALDKIAQRMERGADTEEDLRQLTEIMRRIEPAVGQQGKEAIAAAQQQLNMIQTLISLSQSLNQQIKQAQQRLDQLQSQVDS